MTAKILPFIYMLIGCLMLIGCQDKETTKEQPASVGKYLYGEYADTQNKVLYIHIDANCGKRNMHLINSHDLYSRITKDYNGWRMLMCDEMPIVLFCSRCVTPEHMDLITDSFNIYVEGNEQVRKIFDAMKELPLY